MLEAGLVGFGDAVEQLGIAEADAESVFVFAEDFQQGFGGEGGFTFLVVAGVVFEFVFAG